MSEVILNKNTQSEAKALDLEIKNHISDACTHLVASALALKRMRDTKLYMELGYESFGDYTQKSLNIKERQAYTYISTYENLGERFLQSNANLGITKLSMLAGITPAERENIVVENDIAGMTTQEVKKLVEENSGKGEQIALLNEDIADKEKKISELEAKLQAEQSKPTEIAVRELSPEELQKIKDDAVKKAKKDFKAMEKQLIEKHTTELKAAEKKSKADNETAIADYKAKLTALKEEKEAALQIVENLQKKLSTEFSADAIKFKLQFEELQGSITKMRDLISKIKDDNQEIAEKFKAALLQYLNIMKENVELI